MILYHTSRRNKLMVTSVDDLLIIGTKSPVLALLNAVKCVISWLKTGKHGALGKSTGLSMTAELGSHSLKLFA